MATGRKPFRFGVDFITPVPRRAWVDNCRKAEELGYDVIGVGDHLGMPAPFPALVLAAEHTERVRLKTFVLNTGFYNPVLLAREVTTTDQLTGGRLELGLGAGYVKAEFDAAGIPFPAARQRLDHLESTIKQLKKSYADPDHRPRPVQPSGPPLLLGGRGNGLLTLAAEHADTIAFIGATASHKMLLADAAELADRVGFAKAALGPRAAQVELNVFVHCVDVTGDRRAGLEAVHRRMPERTPEQLAELPTVLVGTAPQLAEQLETHRERYGFSYFTVLEHNLEALAPVIGLLHGK
ncbi:TIGR03621 family F420-dependent LLM class oxidoreductase [Amycolatopsis sp. Hca4]|uniref:TIGR03621 family F420-dependent LLM class oxidoreductase n=1 Tax=Amycolatopsis sp. Hca4 TaxID=2742131 RepID=UPI000D5A4579|nr:TIGR03621 family F420-dependent LLM class oxidoreductase [Amycolatopsis sp. Hca4]AWH12642.1 Rmp11 [Amycolatopsis sp.]QKV76528.1 TIGR03621 family F420-dependent LLM class oxidoreductase [Amycolatopsis sp. Hca4]